MKTTYEEGQRIVDGYVCSFCSGPLILPWSAAMNSHDVGCKKCNNFEQFTPKSAARKAEKADEQRLFSEDAEKADQRYEEATGKEVKVGPTKMIPVNGKSLPAVANPPDLLLTGQDIGTHRELTPVQADMLVTWAEFYGLDAYLGHVVMMYGKPYVGIDGLIYIARQRDPRMRMITTIATPEQKSPYGLGDGDFLFFARVLSFLGDELANGIGIVTREEQEEMSEKKPDTLRYPVVANKPAEMAEKRALYDALRRAFPLERVREG